MGRKVRNVLVQDDPIVYGKVGTSASAFQTAMTGRKIVGAKQQGKYFWLEMDQPPHPLMHFGMVGRMGFSNDKTTDYYRRKKGEEDEWPPKFWKFILELEGEGDVNIAFCDGRRLGRIRLVDAKADEMRKTTPLKENGPDPVIDKNILTVDWLSNKMKSKRVPIKALLLDQANMSGVGNWVGDEVLFQARIHPEQYSNTFSDEQVQKLHDKLIEVCTIACETLAESDRFPENWLMKHRWRKGAKETSFLPTGEKIIHLTVGGRTSAVVPSLQKKTGAVAGDVSAKELNGDDEADNHDEADEKPKQKSTKATNTKIKAVKAEDVEDQKEKKTNGQLKRNRAGVKTEEHEAEANGTPKAKRVKAAPSSKSTPKSAQKPEDPTSAGRRRSGRLSRG